jgi:prepilin-type N-terminal cleavage/methylation domain-containing protein
MMMLIISRQKPNDRGFTLPEVLVAASIMIILAVGTLSVFAYVVRINRGENLREQALSVMQKEIEHYRSIKFVPAASSASSPELDGRTRTQITFGGPFFSADGREFNLFITIDNDPSTSGIQPGNDATCKFKEIKIEAVPTVPERDGWLQNLDTSVTFQRVRSN